MPLCLTVFAGRENSRHMADVGSGLRWEGKAVASGAQIDLNMKITTNSSMRATGNGRRWGLLMANSFYSGFAQRPEPEKAVRSWMGG